MAQETGLEEVIVTATKRSENLQLVPLSVTAVSGARLTELGVTSVLALERATTGLIINNKGNDPTIIMRGAGSASTRDLAVPIYVDSMYRPKAGQALASYFDVERVEVLRGPQGTLFGRNSLGDLVNIIQAKPDAYRLQVLGQRADAERLYRCVLAEDPVNVHALNLLGILCMQSERAGEAVELITAALRQIPDDAEVHANLALALKDAGRLDEAAESLKRSLRYEARNPIAHNNLGNILAALGRDEAAVESFRKALELNPRYADCLCNLAAALTKLGQLAAAMAAASHAISLNPDSAEAHNSLGEVPMKLARHEEAAASYRTAIELNPDYFAGLVNLSAALK